MNICLLVANLLINLCYQIESIERLSAASVAGMTIAGSSFADPTLNCKYCLTEVNGRAVSIFSKVDKLFCTFNTS